MSVSDPELDFYKLLLVHLNWFFDPAKKHPDDDVVDLVKRSYLMNYVISVQNCSWTHKMLINASVETRKYLMALSWKGVGGCDYVIYAI